MGAIRETNTPTCPIRSTQYLDSYGRTIARNVGGCAKIV